MKDSGLEVRIEKRPADWDINILKSGQASVFNTSIWSDALSETFGYPSEVIGVYRNNLLIGGMILSYKFKQGLKIITKIPLCLYNGILFFNVVDSKQQKENELEGKIIESILSVLEKNYKYCDFYLHYSISDIRDFLWKKWKVMPQYSYIVSLNNPEIIWKNFSSSLRRKISRAEEKNIKITEEESYSNLIKLHEESYKRQGIKPVLDSFALNKLCENLKRCGALRIFYAYGNDGKVYSSRAALVWNNKVYDWLAGTAEQYMDTNSTHLLVWNIMKKLSAEGNKTFDFMGANTPKIIDFKKSFGGELVSFYNVTYYSSFIIKTLIGINNLRLKIKRRTI